MPENIIPCDRCEAASADFRKAGFTVHGCDPHPTLTGMCVIRFDRPSSQAALPVAAGDIPLTDTQVRTAKSIVNLFETGHVLGDYGQVTVLTDDPGRLTYGRSQTTLTSGKLAELLQQYAGNPGARFGAAISAWLPAIAAQGEDLDTNSRLHNLLRACADDPVMRETQDRFFDVGFWQPAVRKATTLGIRSALGIAVVYDSTVHGSWDKLRKDTDSQVGTLAQLGEQAWISGYVSTRRRWLATHSIAILRSTVYRMDAFRRLIDLNQWGLALPLVVRGAEISMTALNGTPPGCYDGPAPGTRALSVQAPLLRGLDARLVQLALSDLGADIKADGVFGGASARCVKETQIARGLPVTGVADVALIGALVG
ncbi:peptidoglycan-binding protein [Mitsuaria sp. 7]|uniref:chitosanase n=1 Tax=Mitsuaria sp. 7 TaxID=1658665 RepID=UPI0007DDC715|nr:peptidoglycan-binding protein [Mitsuaria sp. 7]ANH68312.1 chitosanase [Mitsuaria sp. 7]